MQILHYHSFHDLFINLWKITIIKYLYSWQLPFYLHQSLGWHRCSIYCINVVATVVSMFTWPPIQAQTWMDDQVCTFIIQIKQFQIEVFYLNYWERYFILFWKLCIACWTVQDVVWIEHDSLHKYIKKHRVFLSWYIYDFLRIMNEFLQKILWFFSNI